MHEPKQEYRIRFLEKQYLNLGGHFEQLEDEMKASFKQIGELFDQNFERLDKLESDVASVRNDISELKSLILQLLPPKE